MPADRCEELLLGLVSGDFGEEKERDARAEIARCAEHAPALRKVDVGMRFATMLPTVEPRPALDSSILAAARAKAAQAVEASQGKPAAAAPTKGDGLVARALDFLRRMATGPQLAMSTVMLLVVAIGLWYLPAREASPSAAGDTVMAPQFADEMPSRDAPAGPSMAEPPRRDQAPVAQGPGASGSKPEPRSAPAPSPARPSSSTPAGEAVLADRRAVGRTGGESQRRGAPAERAESRGVREDLAVRSRAATGAAAAESARGADDLDALAFSGDSAASRSAARAPSPPAAIAPVAPAPRSPAAAAAPRTYAEAEAVEHAPSGAAERAPSEAADVAAEEGASSAFDRAMALYQAGRYAEAIPLFRSAATGPRAASAIHHLGRSHRAAGQCAMAVQEYERLLAAHPSYGQRTQAMIEAADCYRRTGHLAAAERWLERASATSPTSIAARRELDRVRAMRSADQVPAGSERAAPPATSAEDSAY